MDAIPYIPLITEKDRETGCCPRFHPEDWDGKVFDFSNYSFIRTSTRSFFYIPLNMNGVMRKAQAAIEQAKAAPVDRYLMLSEDVSLFKCHHDLLVTQAVPGYPLVKVTGKWFAKVYEGYYKDLPNWMRDLQKIALEKNLTIQRVLTYYTTCPNCAKKYGHNYVVLFGLVES